MDKNKIKFGFSGVAIAFDDLEGGYETPTKIPGGVNVALDLEGGETVFYADNGKYYVSNKNNGYKGSMEVANFPQAILNKALGWYIDANGNAVEDADGKQRSFALLFQVDGDVENNRTVFYDCKISRPSINAETSEDDDTPQPDSVDLTIIPKKFDSLGKKIVKLVCPEDSTSYDTFYDAVVEPGAPAEDDNEDPNEP